MSWSALRLPIYKKFLRLLHSSPPPCTNPLLQYDCRNEKNRTTTWVGSNYAFSDSSDSIRSPPIWEWKLWRLCNLKSHWLHVPLLLFTTPIPLRLHSPSASCPFLFWPSLTFPLLLHYFPLKDEDFGWRITVARHSKINSNIIFQFESITRHFC